MTELLLHHRAPTPGRAVKAWLAGCGAAALTGYWAMGVIHIAGPEAGAASLIVEMATGLPRMVAFAALAVFLTSVPMPLVVCLERGLHWRRGMSDMLTGAAMAALLAQLFGLPVLGGAQGLALTAFAALSGAMGGLTYWLMAGRPA
jgi:uncharacterized protein YcfJ